MIQCHKFSSESYVNKHSRYNKFKPNFISQIIVFVRILPLSTAEMFNPNSVIVSHLFTLCLAERKKWKVCKTWLDALHLTSTELDHFVMRHSPLVNTRLFRAQISSHVALWADGQQVQSILNAFQVQRCRMHFKLKELSSTDLLQSRYNAGIQSASTLKPFKFNHSSISADLMHIPKCDPINVYIQFTGSSAKKSTPNSRSNIQFAYTTNRHFLPNSKFISVFTQSYIYRCLSFHTATLELLLRKYFTQIFNKKFSIPNTKFNFLLSVYHRSPLLITF